MTIHSILGAIVIGLFVGALGRLLVPGKQPMPLLMTMLVGVVAAFIGSALARAMGIPIDTPGVDWGELLVQVIVAALGVGLVTMAFGGTFGRRSFGRGSRLTRRW
jgi:uncharacterized membrane protein YeaQ/YmgE (transglycosylase-associated protein family)